MDRYSTFFGTSKAGGYTRLGSSPNLKAFLEKSIGAYDVDEVISEVEKVLKGFETLPGYESEQMNIKPLAIRYAPMHLYKKPNMNSDMKEFCALCVNGAEHREDSERVSFYSHTYVFPVTLMHKSGERNYLDQLFGTYCVSCKEAKNHREKVCAIEYERVPDKVNPVLNRWDRLCVFKAVEAIYSGRNVVIRLEKDCAFNSRSRELLMQIYSLLPPKVATEVGFASYQNPNDIPGLIRETSIRIFVLPAGADLEKLSGDKMEILDLSAGRLSPLERSAFIDALTEWSKLTWEVRQPAMEATFAYMEDAESIKEFVACTEEYFRGRTELANWLEGNKQQIGSLKDLRAREMEGTFWKKLPNGKKILAKHLPKVLAPGLTIEDLNAEAAARLFFERTQEAKADYDYGKMLGDVDVGKLTSLVSARQKTKDDEQFKAEKDALVAAHKADNDKHAQVLAGIKEKVDKLKEQHESEKSHLSIVFEEEKKKLTAEHEAALKAEQDARQADNEKNAEELQAEKNAHQDDNKKYEKALLDAETAHTNAMTEARTQFDRLMEEKEAEHTRQKDELQSECRKLFEKQKQEYTEELSAEREKTRLAENRNTELQNQLTAAQTAQGEAERKAANLEGELQTVQNNLDKANRQLEKAQNKVARLENKLTENNIELDQEEPEDSGEAHGYKGYSRKDKGSERNIKELIICAAAGLLVGLVLMGIIWGITAAVSGNAEETVPTTLPVETTIPVQTTEPVETTVPVETTEPPTEPALDEVDWDETLYFSGMTAVESNEWTAENLLSGYELADDARILGIVTTEKNGFFGEYGKTLPETFAVLMLKNEDGVSEEIVVPEETAVPKETGVTDETDETAVPEETTVPEETEEFGETTEPEVTTITLEDEASMIIEGGHYRLVVVGGEETQKAALKMFGLLNPQEDSNVTLRVKMPDGTELALEQMLSQTLTAENWWVGIREVSFLNVDLTYGQTMLASSRTPVAAVFAAEGTVYLYDYSDNAENARQMLNIQAQKGRAAVQVDGIVAICYIAE